MGRNRDVVRISFISDEGTAMDGVIFMDGDLFTEEKDDCRVMDVTYYPGINEYNEDRNPQIVVKSWKPHQESEVGSLVREFLQKLHCSGIKRGCRRSG